MLKSMLKRMEAIEACRFETPRVATIFRDLGNEKILNNVVIGKLDVKAARIHDLKTLSDEELNVIIGTNILFVGEDEFDELFKAEQKSSGTGA